MRDITNYDSYYDDPMISGRSTTKKKERTSTRKKSTEPTTENGIISKVVCLKMREEPSPESKVVTHLNAKDQVEILGEEGDYYKVRLTSGDIGYILSKFCDKE